jgi:hypothetical protein
MTQREISRRYYLKHSEECKERTRDYYRKNPEAHKKAVALWESKHQEDVRRFNREWYRAHPEFSRAKNRKNWENPQLRFAQQLRNYMRDKLNGVKKVDTTFSLTGCSVAELKKYLESKFLPGMAWENYGIHGWHIDHIRPCSSFDLTDPEQQRICFHYTNLQPLWAADNIRKGAKIA